MSVAEGPPNILFIQADQLTASALGAYGNGFALTPHIDELARGGALFQSAYCPFPLCGPSRYGMMTGRLPSRVGAFDNACELPAGMPTLAHYLRRGGYLTVLSGKMHFVGPDQLHGFERRLTSDIYPSDFSWAERPGQGDAKMKSNPRCITEAGPCVRSVQMDYDEMVMSRARQELFDLARGPEKRPWFMLVSLTHPHDPYYCSYEHWARYENVEIPAPRLARRSYEEHDALGQFLCDRHGLDADFGEEAVRRARRGYFGSVSYVDDKVGELLQQLSELGLRERTLVVFTSDHGEMLGERGLWYKRHFFEDSVRVPLIMALPGAEAREVAENVSLLDLLPSLMDLAGIDGLLQPTEGRSLRPLLQGVRPPGWENVVHSEVMSDGLSEPAFMVKRDRFKLITGLLQGSQLYDLEKDPDEQTDLSSDPAHADVFKRMMAEVAQVRDVQALKAEIARSLDQRILVREALALGEAPDWDFSAPGEGQNRWCRRGMNYNNWALNVLKKA